MIWDDEEKKPAAIDADGYLTRKGLATFLNGPLRHMDWPEDLGHENGAYWCICSGCTGRFQGHKRRTLCKICANKEKKDEKAKVEKS